MPLFKGLQQFRKLKQKFDLISRSTKKTPDENTEPQWKWTYRKGPFQVLRSGAAANLMIPYAAQSIMKRKN